MMIVRCKQMLFVSEKAEELLLMSARFHIFAHYF